MEHNITSEKVVEYIHRYYQPQNEKLAAMREDAEKRWIPVILKETEEFLALLMSLFHPRQILEIGTAIGYSAAFFAAAADARIVTIERDEEMYREACQNIEELGLGGQISCLPGDAEAVLLDLQKEVQEGRRGPFDFVFIDAGKSHYTEFLSLALPMLQDGALVLCDNILMRGTTVSDEYDPKGKHKTNIRKMREFIDWITSDERFVTTLYPIGDGISCSIVKKK